MLTYQAMSNSDDVVLLLEQDDAAEAVIIAANEAFLRVSGFSDIIWWCRPVAELFPVGHQAEALLTALRSGDSLRAELRCSRDGGDSFTLGMHLMPAPTRMVGRACFVILGRDITTLVQARQVRDFGPVAARQGVQRGRYRGGDRQCGRADHDDQPASGPGAGLPAERSGRTAVAGPGRAGIPAKAALQAAIAQQAVDACDARFAVTAVRDDGSELPAEVTSVVATTGEAKTFRILTLRPTVANSRRSAAKASAGSGWPGWKRPERHWATAGRRQPNGQ